MIEKQNLVRQGKAYLQPITIKGNKIATIDRTKMFFTPPTMIRERYDNILQNCHYIRRYILSHNDKKLNTLYPDFVFNELVPFVRPRNKALDEFRKGDVVLMPRTEYNKITYVEMHILNFFISDNKYKDWLTTPYSLLNHPILKDIPKPINECEQLFDENGLPIKKLVKDIGDLNNLTIKETKNFFLYDDRFNFQHIFYRT